MFALQAIPVARRRKPEPLKEKLMRATFLEGAARPKRLDRALVRMMGGSALLPRRVLPQTVLAGPGSRR